MQGRASALAIAVLLVTACTTKDKSNSADPGSSEEVSPDLVSIEQPDDPSIPPPRDPDADTETATGATGQHGPAGAHSGGVNPHAGSVLDLETLASPDELPESIECPKDTKSGKHAPPRSQKIFYCIDDSTNSFHGPYLVKELKGGGYHGFIDQGIVAGPWRRWAPNGQVVQETHYDGSKVVLNLWNEDGTPQYLTKVQKDGSQIVTLFWPNGQKRSESSYRSGVRNGPYRAWHDNGQVAATGTYQSDKAHGDFEFFHPNGKIAKKGKLFRGLRIDTWTEYDETGKKIGEGQYKLGRYVGGQDVVVHVPSARVKVISKPFETLVNMLQSRIVGEGAPDLSKSEKAPARPKKDALTPPQKNAPAPE